MKMVPLDWSVDPRDWSQPGVRKIVRNIMKEHPCPGRSSWSTTAAEISPDGQGARIVLPRLLDEGYHFETP